VLAVAVLSPVSQDTDTELPPPFIAAAETIVSVASSSTPGARLSVPESSLPLTETWHSISGLLAMGSWALICADTM
jgi:hypothetical protein